jgi:hypothetical protein
MSRVLFLGALSRARVYRYGVSIILGRLLSGVVGLGRDLWTEGLGQEFGRLLGF